MEIEFIPYEQALALKELGFDEPCLGLWNINNGKHEVDIIGVCKYSKEFKYREVIAPLYQQAFRWFREKHGHAGFIELIEPEYDGDYGYVIYYKLNHLSVDHWNKGFKTYEEAELACLKKLIEIVKTK